MATVAGTCVKTGCLVHLPEYGTYHQTDAYLVGNCLVVNGMQNTMYEARRDPDIVVPHVSAGYLNDESVLVIPTGHYHATREVVHYIDEGLQTIGKKFHILESCIIG